MWTNKYIIQYNAGLDMKFEEKNVKVEHTETAKARFDFKSCLS